MEELLVATTSTSPARTTARPPPGRDYARMLRARAFGKFSDLLPAVIRTRRCSLPQQRDSTGEHPNENLGRELLELHTVGRAGRRTARRRARLGPDPHRAVGVDGDSAEFAYKPWRHWTGPVQVLGFSDPNPTQTGGLAVARRYLTYLAHHADTARTGRRKLARRFVADDPAAVAGRRAGRRLPRARHRDRAGAAGAVRLRGVPGSIGRKTRAAVRAARRHRARPRHSARPPATATDGIFSLYWMADSAAVRRSAGACRTATRTSPTPGPPRPPR